MQIIANKESKILENLNTRQLESASSLSSSNLVIAGAGSGKTSVLIRRVAYLITSGLTPGQILCLTFTNKAAKEMNSRVRNLLTEVDIEIPYVPVWQNDYFNSPLLCTFHSLGVRILREFGDSINLKKDFNILDTDDQKKIIKDIFKELNIDQKSFNPSLAGYFISKCKQELLQATQSNKLSEDYLPIFHQIYAKYETRLKSNNVVDFDDLILLPYIIFRDDPKVCKQIQDRWKHLMIDEFQDTNPAQFRLIKLICPPNLLKPNNSEKIPDRSIFAVGDDAQSIYGFRGSRIEIILNFEKEYPGTKEIILNQNYRSTQPILDLAEQVLSHNPHQKKKDLFTDRKDKISVKYYQARNEKDEAEYIIRQLYQQYVTKSIETKKNETKKDKVEFIPDDFFEESKVTKKRSDDPVSNMFDFFLEDETIKPTSGLASYNSSSWQVPEYNWHKLEKLNDCVVLYRTHSQSRSLEETFLKTNLPYRLVSGVRFLDRKEIKDIIAILKFLSNGEDKLSLARFLPLILDGVGAKTMEKIIAYLDDYEYPLALKYQEKLLGIFQALQNCWQESTNLIQLTQKVIMVSGYQDYLKKTYPIVSEREARMENIGEIYSLMHQFDEDKSVPLSDRLQAFLEQVSLMSKLEDEVGENTPKINLMSLHQSKGLEFETVFLVGVEDGLLPHQNSLINPADLEEEVRLAYVGVTRAKQYLHLISATSRIQFGQIRTNQVSRIFRPFVDTYCLRVR